MTIEAGQSAPVTADPQTRPTEETRSRSKSRTRWWSWRNWFSSLTRRIVIFNLIALGLLVGGILYLNQFRAGLTDAKVQSLRVQSEIIAGAIAASATIESDVLSIDPERLLALRPGESVSPAEEEIESLDFPINPERAAPVLRRLITPMRGRARIFDRDGVLIVDSRDLFSRSEILQFDLPPPEEDKPDTLRDIWQVMVSFFRRGDLPLYTELPPDEGKKYPEVIAALSGASVSVVRVNEKGELIVFVAVPVQRFRAVLGALVLSTNGGDIDAIVTAERWGIFRVFLVAAGVTLLMSFFLASAIAGPVRRLATAAERVRKGRNSRVEIPDFTARRDEIGHLSGALRDMTTALYDRIDAIERFAADVSHELKNPLTSLRSAVETLPLAKDETARKKLTDIVQDDVQRLNRLITDISAASRLDAELAREEPKPVSTADLIEVVIETANATRTRRLPIRLSVNPGQYDRDKAFQVLGQDLRIGQVIRNLIDNALSFSPAEGEVHVILARLPDEVEIVIEDEGPGIAPENRERIFERFYTDRPHEDAFGRNSGLGLSISRQIVEALDGELIAEARLADDNGEIPAGARMVVRLPAMDDK